MYYDGKPKGELDKRELEAARLGFRQLLRCKRFSPHFIDTHAEDLFGTATLEYSRKLAEGEEIYDPPGWLITCAWRRTKSHLEAERSGPVVDEEGQGPEDILLDTDRFRKVREAVADLSADQRRILALSYFEGLTVREAGRELRWHSSKAQRAHEGAKRKLHKLLGVSSSDDLAIEIGLAAYLATTATTAVARGGRLPGLHDFLDRTAQKATESVASLKQQASTAYTRAVDPTPLAAVRPGTVASVVASCIAIGGGAATYCADQGVNPIGAARNLIASSSEPEAADEAPEEEEPSSAPVYTPAAEEPAVEEEAPPPESSAPPAEEAAPAPKPEPSPPPPPDDGYEPVRPEYMAPEAEPTSTEESSSAAAPVATSSSPAPVAANAGRQFGGP
jgi:RNA polymerase sigma factor (sigma-70 family)